MSRDHNQHQKNDFNPDWDAMAVLVEENQRLAKQLSELKDWEAIAADQAATIAMMKLDSVTLSADGKSVFIDGVGDVPLQCEWVSLTDEQIAEAVGSPIDEVYLADFRKVEAKLKEKNT